jgi:hypothetical protein
MLKKTVLMTALAVAFGVPLAASAADDRELAQIRDQIRQLKESYETRIQALEKRLQEAETRPPTAQQSQPAATLASGAPASASAFNPAVSLILDGTYANLSQDPAKYRLQGFLPSGNVGPGKRGFSLGESELVLSANIDPHFAGWATLALAPDNSISVEEAFFQTLGLSNGINVKAGRFMSAIGYLNSQHAHAWDFVDAPLAYQAFLGGQYKPDGVQIKWLAPTEQFLELGLEAGSAPFPGNDRNKNGIGSTTVFAHVGDDIGESASWRAGLSYLKTSATDRTYSDIDHTGFISVTNAFSGNTDVWIADAVYKWAPNGNPIVTNFKLQGEYFRRKENGTLTYDTLRQSSGSTTGNYASAQSGWYLQGVYQFMPKWRTGLRYDKLYSGTQDIGGLNPADFTRLASYNPSRSTLMVDYSPSEFSRFRLQFARDQSRPEATDNQIFLQYIMSLGAHGAHTF